MTREWTAEIVRQEPDREVSWRSRDGAKNDGTVSFAAIGTDRTRVTLRLDFEPEGAMEKAGDMLQLVEAQARSGKVQGVHRASPGRNGCMARLRFVDR